MATLKIRDLSVGDWVKMEDKHYQIYHLTLKGDVYGYRKVNTISSEEYFDGSIAYVCPIPITAEILGNNGFSHNGNKWYTPELFTLERWSKGWTIVIACACGDYVCEVYTIKYVHQLQHALRLAGIDKEINL